MATFPNTAADRWREPLAYLAIIVAFILFFLWFALPLWQEEQSLTLQIASTGDEINWLLERPEWREQSESYTELPSIDQAIILTFLENLGYIHEVAITELSLMPSIDLHELRGDGIRLRLSGTYDALLGMLLRLENPDQYLMQVQSWSFTGDGSSDTYALTLELLFWGSDRDDLALTRPGGATTRNNPFYAP